MVPAGDVGSGNRLVARHDDAQVLQQAELGLYGALGQSVPRASAMRPCTLLDTLGPFYSRSARAGEAWGHSYEESNHD